MEMCRHRYDHTIEDGLSRLAKRCVNVKLWEAGGTGREEELSNETTIGLRAMSRSVHQESHSF